MEARPSGSRQELSENSYLPRRSTSGNASRPPFKYGSQYCFMQNFIRSQGHKRHGAWPIIPKTRREKQETLVELRNARFLSPDLVDDVFGAFLPPEIISVAVESFLEKDILRAYDLSTEQRIPQARYHEAAAKAEYDARHVGCHDASRGKRQKDGFKWEWNLGSSAHPSSESGATKFLNSIATKSFEAIYESFPVALGARWPQWRFARPPHPSHPLSLADDVEQVDQRPDGCLLPIVAWEKDSNFINFEPGPDREFEDREVDAPDEYTPVEGEKEEEEDYHQVASHRPTPSQEDRAARDSYSQYITTPEISDYSLNAAYANWSQTRLVLELKHPDLYSAIRQTHLNLRTLHRVQPFLVSALGIALTRKHLCFVRSDSSVCEECPIDISTSRGVLDTIRVALGLVVARDTDTGLNPNFRLTDVETSVTVSKPQGPGEKRAKVQQSCIQRCVESISRDDTVYQVVEIISNTSSFPGRGTTVFKVTAGDPSSYFALKITWIDIRSESKENDLWRKTREAQVEYVLLPAEDGCWLSGLRTDQLRGDTAGSIFNGVETREETYSLTPYKLSLAQFRKLSDFVNGLICVLKGMRSLLDKTRLLHADINFNNIVFDDPALTGDSLAKAWLINLDNACVAEEEAEESSDKAFGDFPGTVPFMAIDVMQYGAARRIRHDVESVFYVLYLFFFTFNGPNTEDGIPRGNPWPDEVREWTNGTSLPAMGRSKFGYFCNSRIVRWNLRDSTQPYWRDPSSNKVHDAVYQLVDGAYTLMWTVDPTFSSPAFAKRTPEIFIQYLETWLTGNL
ncbi:hypothetical protein B0H11DRAFT_1904738 [Mycena galericulata]|nr:hypothetical protein B0H11DRAFT_1904738 [Mycena galericulata]